MKSFRFLLVFMLILLIFTACNKEAAIQTTTLPAATAPSEPAITEPTVPPTEPVSDVPPTLENLYSAALPITTDKFYTENGGMIFSYSYQTMYLDIPDRDVEDKIIMNFGERIERTMGDSQVFLAQAEAAYQNSNSFVPFSYEVQYDVTYIGQGVLSLFGHILQIDDSPAMIPHLVAANYNMVTGDVMTLGSILYHIDAKDDLVEQVIQHLENRDDITLYDEFRETVEARFTCDESIDEDFYFSENGLCFYFEPYEIAPRSAGTVIVEIPYNKLTGIIGDEYFPAERIYTTGTLSVSDLQTADQDKYQNFIDVIADPEGRHMLLTTETAVQDIRIYQLVWSRDGKTYTQTKNIYASNFLYRDNAIMIQADFDNMRPNYMVTYSIDGSTYVFYMVMDSETKQIKLASSL